MSQVAFQYRAVDRRGRRTVGQVKAADRTEAYRQLVSAGLKPWKITRARRKLSGRRRERISIKDLSHLTYQLSVLMEARIPIVDGIMAIADQEPNPSVRRVLEEVAHQVAAGNTVTDSLETHRQVFGDIYIETIRAAEVSGNMVEVLARLAEMLDRQYEINKAVKGAMMYPLCVVGALMLALAFLLIFVVPRFSTMFASRGVELPLPTQFLLGFSAFIRTYWYVVIGSTGLAIWGTRRAWSNPFWRQRIDGWLHAVPFLRQMLKGLAVGRFAHVFGLTLQSGLSLIDALEVSGRASGRPMLQKDTLKMQQQVNRGGRLSDVLLQCTYLPGFAKRLLTAGEEAAELTKMCAIVARHYDREVTYLSKNVTTVIEPMLIVGLAGVVLIVALAIFLPMWNMAALVG